MLILVLLEVQCDQHSLSFVLRGTLQLALETLKIRLLLMLFTKVCMYIYIFFFFLEHEDKALFCFGFLLLETSCESLAGIVECTKLVYIF